MASFNVVIVRPAGNHFISAAFQDIGVLLRHTLHSLGHGYTLQNNDFDPAATNIVLGYHLLPDAEPIRAHRSIVYQLEQLPNQHQGWLKLDERKIAIMQAAQAVWDFSPENISFLSRNGICSVRHVPFGYHEAMRTIESNSPFEFDVFFYGTISVRRKVVIEGLAQRCRLKASFGVYGARRDQFIARSKVVLNLRNTPGPSIMEQPRISHLLNNRRFAITEDATDNPYGDAVVAVAYDKLVECCMRYLADDIGREQMADRGFEFLRARPMTAYLAPALD